MPNRFDSEEEYKQRGGCKNCSQGSLKDPDRKLYPSGEGEYFWCSSFEKWVHMDKGKGCSSWRPNV